MTAPSLPADHSARVALPGASADARGAPEASAAPEHPPSHPPRPRESAVPAPRPRKRGLSAQAEVHDRQQFELRFNYALQESARQRYLVDVYLFVPRNVGVNRGNYSREQFYGDFTAYLRLDAARLRLDHLADARNPASPLHRLAAALDALRTAPRPPPSRPMRADVKLYANLYARGVRAEARALQRRLVATARALAAGEAPEGAAAHASAELDRALGRAREALWAYRRVRAAFWPFEQLCHQSLADALRAADEYMSLAFEERLAQLSLALAPPAARPDGSGFVVRARLALARAAREEADYRRHYGYLTLARADEPRTARAAGEYFTYRASQLKKAVQQALYLNLRGSRGDLFIRNAASAVAAALAAIWALATQLPNRFAGLATSTQMLMFTGAVLAYVMKDRIKALVGEALIKRARRYDHTFWVYGDALADLGLGKLTARLSESVRFVTDAEVPADVRATRAQRRTVRHAESGGEEVIHYRKRLDVASRDKTPAAPEGHRIRDIVRINVRHFQVRLDDPLDRVEYFDTAAGAFAAASLPKVYHLNLVVRIRCEVAGCAPEERLTHLRVVLDKDGLRRVEEVAARPRERALTPAAENFRG